VHLEQAGKPCGRMPVRRNRAEQVRNLFYPDEQVENLFYPDEQVENLFYPDEQVENLFYQERPDAH
jgi:hypothetical protein